MIRPEKSVRETLALMKVWPNPEAARALEWVLGEYGPPEPAGPNELSALLSKAHSYIYDFRIGQKPASNNEIDAFLKILQDQIAKAKGSMPNHLVPADPLTICVAPRLMDPGKFKAWLKSNSAIWGAGRNSYEAIGSMIAAHPEMFSIGFEFLDSDVEGKPVA